MIAILFSIQQFDHCASRCDLLQKKNKITPTR